GQLSCTEGQDVCAEVSFEGGARILKDVCFSAPCPVLCESATARCTGPQGEEFCLPIAGDCPLLCGPGEENFDATGQRQEDSLQCVPQTELPCPCGRNARRCVDPRLGASCVAATEDCPTSCDSSRLCLSASFTPEGAFQELQSQCTALRVRRERQALQLDGRVAQRTNQTPMGPGLSSPLLGGQDYNRSTGELLGVRQTCANEGDVCPCGDFAFRCQDVCVPGAMAGDVSDTVCGDDARPQPDVCVPPEASTTKALTPAFQGVFEDTNRLRTAAQNASQLLEAHSFSCYCPVHCAGGVQCPLVTNFHPDGAEIGSSVDVLVCLGDVDFLVIVL
ncbi:hypothetical protein AK812_SmicGene46070, partial [Symbiodinium microadriaticum]